MPVGPPDSVPRERRAGKRRLRGDATFAGAILLLGASACAPRPPALPTGAGTPAPDAAAVYDAAISGCRNVRTFQATLALSGRAASQRLRGTLDAGFEAPASVRLEMRGPIGRAVFILAATSQGATLLLPRDNRVLHHDRAADIVEALVGLRLDAGDLRALVSGCGFGAMDASGGTSYPAGWLAVQGGTATTYLREIGGTWRVAAASRPPLTVTYADFGPTGRPSSLRLLAERPTRADVTVRLSDVTTNVPLPAEVFAVTVPPGAEPLTLDELRGAGPLGDP